jgi:LPXTG-motif cell wall-anchored protein
MRRAMAILALTGALCGWWALPVGAQQNGIVIENNGVDNSNSAAGADNVRISRADGNSSSNNGAGANNETANVVNEKNRARKDRGDRNNADELAAPAEEAPAAPAEGDYQAYTDDSGYADPAAAAQEEVAQPAGQSNLPIKLPNTGVGDTPSLPLAAMAAALLAMALGGVSLKRRLV